MKVIKRIIELLIIFLIIIVTAYIVFYLLSDAKSRTGIFEFFEIFATPITSIPWNSNSHIETPILGVFMGISLFIDHTLWRRGLMGLIGFLWFFVGLGIYVN